MKRTALKWELIGIVVISVLGAILHFAFEWSGQLRIVGVIAAVNESVWEHFKIGFWPALFYAALEYSYLRKLTGNFMIAKAIGIYVIPITIAVLFYSYTILTGEEILLVDILIFVLAIAVGQLVSYKVLTSHPLPKWLGKMGLILLILLGVSFVVFTFWPPHLPIFEGPVTGGYGI